MKKVIIGISGGVDSSVAAYLLKKDGYEVIGITLKMLDDQDINDAKNICKMLNIDHHIIDITNDFKEIIINNFINEYKNGFTPNPCVLCNKKIKFKYLYEALKDFNADYIATGHYSKIFDKGIFKGKDLNKDQSYFLCNIDKNILDKIILPLEGLTKEEVREIAKNNDLITANKKDSYDVCFIKDNFNDFIDSNIKCTKGKIIDIETKKELGIHNGLMHYTIGQRRGLNVGGTESRLYVVGKNIKDNILYVSTNNEYLKSDSCIVENVNLLIDEKITSCMAKFRYRQKETKVLISYINDSTIELNYELTDSVTPGQTCSLYINDKCIGGGTIKEVKKNNNKLWYLL